MLLSNFVSVRNILFYVEKQDKAMFKHFDYPGVFHFKCNFMINEKKPRRLITNFSISEDNQPTLRDFLGCLKYELSKPSLDTFLKDMRYLTEDDAKTAFKTMNKAVKTYTKVLGKAIIKEILSLEDV